MTDTPRKPLSPPKTSIFDRTLSGVQEEPALQAPKRGLLGRILHRTPAGDAPSDPQPEPAANTEVRPLRRPKTSIFDVTEYGAPELLEAHAVRPGECATAPGAPLGQPKESIFDATDPGLPEAPAAPAPAPAAAEACVPAPSRPQEVPVRPDPDEWDEGTAAEWNPRWASAAAATHTEVRPEPGNAAEIPSSRRGWILPAIGTAAVVLVAVLAVRPFIHGPGATSDAAPELSPELRDYRAHAETGDTASMRMLGLRYSYGIGVPLNRKEGLRWLRRAAQGGSKTAVSELAALGAGPS